MNILVTGANRGIGLELCRLFIARGHTVTGTARDPATTGPLRETGATVEILDVQRDDAVEAFGAHWGSKPLDVLVNNAGVGAWTPLTQTTTEELLRVFDINAVGPLRVTRALLPALRASRGRVFHITSKMGSIGDTPSGGSYAYRMSKAALNMASANLAADLRPAGVASIVLHPGWVQTDMGGRNAPLTVAESARSLADLMERTGFEATGQFLNFDGRPIPW
jgi:NAD(P)-dependent dehydrogenase (short-subunit alcohol dehydrogenase family)